MAPGSRYWYQGQKYYSNPRTLVNNVLCSINKYNKKRNTDAIIKSITLSSCKVWSVKERMLNMLRSTEISYQRRTAGRSERITNGRNRKGSRFRRSWIEGVNKEGLQNGRTKWRREIGKSCKPLYILYIMYKLTTVEKIITC